MAVLAYDGISGRSIMLKGTETVAARARIRSGVMTATDANAGCDSPRATTPIERAISRVSQLTERICDLRESAQSAADRLHGSEDCEDGNEDRAKEAYGNGQLGELHVNLSVLESAVSALNEQLRRLTEL